MITMHLEIDQHPRPLGNTYVSTLANGQRIPIGLTEETGEVLASKLLALFNVNEVEIEKMVSDYQNALEANDKLVKAGKPGRKWPAFDVREKLLSRLCKEADIVDS